MDEECLIALLIAEAGLCSMLCSVSVNPLLQEHRLINRARLYVECPSTVTDGEELCQRLEQLQRILKTEPDEEDAEPVDIIAVKEVSSSRVKVKQEQEETEEEPKYFLGLCPSSQFIRDTAEQVMIIQTRLLDRSVLLLLRLSGRGGKNSPSLTSFNLANNPGLFYTLASCCRLV